MANVFTDYAFLHNNLNLNRLDLGAYDAYFYDDANIEFNSINYKDVYEIYWTYGDSYNVSAFAGPSLNVSSGIVTGGTVTGYLEGYWDGSVWQYTWGLQNISIDGAALIAAVKTTETEDDYIIFDAVLTGADIFDLSNANDFAYGLAGDDTLNGYGGGDTLHGDAGDDTLNGGDGDDILYGGRGTDTVNGGDGNDILDGGSGDDVLIGGAGNDTYSLPTIDSADVAIIEDGSGYLISSSYGRDSLASVEQITLSDGTFEISDLATKLTTTASPGYRYFELTGDDLVDAMTHGHSWDLGPDRTIDFAIANGFNGEYWFDPSDVTSHLDSALQLISKYTDVKFNNLGFFADPAIAYEYGAEITLSLDGSAKFFQDPKYLGRAFFPSNNEDVSAGYVGAGGDLYLNIDSKANSYTSYEPGSQGWFLLLHELGHVLGLKHPHDDGGTGRPTFEELNRGELNDDTTTVMSYEDTTESLNEVSYDPATPMILDVLALQYLYGKNTSTNSGDTTFDLAANEGYYLTHWDADGDDLIDATNTSSGWQIVLPTVTGSALIDTQVGWAYSLSPNGTVNDETRVWLAGEIENATGSRFDDALTGNTLDNSLHGGAGNDTIDGGAGDDVLIGGAGDDTIILESNGTFGSDLFAYNTTSSVQAGTEESINLDGKTRFGDVMDGGANVDTVELTDSSDAFFLHDSFSGFHSSLTLVEDYDSRLGTARIANIENINSGLGDDIVDLTSPDYSLVGQNITVDGGSGDDTLWGSDANETLKGGVGDDELFGGAGTNVLTGGAGADEFQFTKTSKNDTVKDFSLSDGDTLKFFNKGGAQFDRSSVSLNNAGDVLSISDGTDVLTITLEGAGLQMADLGSDVLIIG
jgi:Ca2+-binding RTX toxin-like protein